MYDKLLERLNYCRNNAAIITDSELLMVIDSAAAAIEELDKRAKKYKKQVDYLSRRRMINND